MTQVILLLVSLWPFCGVEAVPTPPKTVDIIDRFNQMAHGFRNCEFSAVQTNKTTKPDGSGYVVVSRSAGLVCEDAVVVHVEKLLTKQMTPTGERLLDRTTYEESRWIRGKPRFTLDLGIVERPNEVGLRWLLDNSLTPNRVYIRAVKQKLESERDPVLAWGPLLATAFLEGAYSAGGPLAAMVAGDQPWGYTVDSTEPSLTAQTTSVSYHFVSVDYGTMDITLTKLTDWKPTRIHLIKLAQHVVDPTLPEESNQVGNYQKFVGFSQPTTGLDRVDQVYELAFSPTASDIDLPESMRYVETRSWNGEQEVIDVVLDFDKLKSGRVPCDNVTSSMLNIPDGTEAFMVRVPGLDKIEWETRGGEVVKKTSAAAIRIGQEAKFASTRNDKLWLIVLNLTILLVVAVVLYRRRNQKNT